MAEQLLQKGKRGTGGAYAYRCGCGFKNMSCPFCYGNDLERCQVHIRTARGKRYYGLLKTILGHVGKTMCEEVIAIRNQDGKAVAGDLAYVAQKYKLSFKAVVEWLEECGVVRPGTYERIKESIRITDALEVGKLAAVCYSGVGHEICIEGNKCLCRRCGKIFLKDPNQPQ